MQASFQGWTGSFSGPAARQTQVASAPLDYSSGQLKDLRFGVAVVGPGMKDSPVHPNDKPGCQNKHSCFWKLQPEASWMKSDWDLCNRPADYLSTPLLPAVNTVGHSISCSHGPSSETAQARVCPVGMPRSDTLRRDHVHRLC